MKNYIDKLKEVETLVELSIGTTMTEEKATDIYALTNELMCMVKNKSSEREYLQWVNQANLPPLTNTQAKFAQWLLRDDNVKVIAQVGNLAIIFNSVRKWIKNGC